MKKSYRIDAALGALGLVISVAVFVAQGPYELFWQYALVAAPILAAALFIGAHLTWRRFKKLRNSLSKVRHLYGLLEGTDIVTSITIRILNAEGDMLVHRRSRLALIKGGVVVDKTTKSFIGSREVVPDLPPVARLVDSSNVGQEVIAANVSLIEPNAVNAGDVNFAYQWQYSLRPPLQTRGSFVEYEYDFQVPRAAALAFRDGGEAEEINFSHTAVSSSVDCTLISCEGYTIKVLDTFRQEPTGEKIPLQYPEAPEVNSNGHLLSWKPAYSKGSLFVCKYKMVKQ